MTVQPAKGLSLIRIIIPYLRRERRSFVLALCLLAPYVVLPLMPPRLVKSIIDVELPGGLSGALLTSCAILAGVIILDFIMRLCFSWMLRSLGLRIVRNLRKDLFAHLQRLPLSYFRKTPRGRVVARLTTDLEQIDNMFASGGLMLVAEAFTIVFILIAMGFLSPRLALYSVALIPVMLVIVAWIRTRMKAVYRRMRQELSEMNVYCQESISAHEVIKILARRRRFTTGFHEKVDDYRKTSVTANGLEAAFFAGVDFFGALTVALVVYAAAGREIATVGLLVAMSQYIQQLFIPLRGVASRIATFQQAMVALERVHAFLQQPEEEAATPRLKEIRTGRSTRLVVDDLRFGYFETTPVLKGVNLAIDKGEHVALIGETGSGKSTLARLLAGLYQPWSGSLLRDGEDLTKLSLSERRKAVTLVSQEVFLFDVGVPENISLGRDINNAKMNELIEMIGWGTESSGDAGSLGEWGRRLSNGERQMLAAARLVAHDPEFVVFDEATSSLDPLSDAKIRDAMRGSLSGRGALIIAHRLSTLLSCDRIAVMNDGIVTESGTHKELYEKSESYRRLYRLFELDEMEVGSLKEAFSA